MQPVTSEQAQILKRSHTAIFKAEVLDNGVPVLTLPVQSGRVDVDGANAIRRKVSLALVGDDLVPGDTKTGNIALKQPVTASKASVDATNRPLSRVTDGSTIGDNWTGFDAPPSEGWVQVDLGAVHLIDRVRVWHYWPDGRTYNLPRTETSLDGVTWSVVSRPPAYAETSAGHLRRFSPIRARYVRDYISGNSVNTANHWTEVQVFAALDPLTPYGNEVRVMRGIKVPGKPDVWWPLGVFGITRPSVSDTGDNLLISLTADDRARTVQRARLRAEYVVAAGTNYATAIKALIQDGVPFLKDSDFAFTTTSRTTPALTYEIGDDRWQRAQEMAAAMGAELFFDPNGRCTLQPVQASTTLPTTWDFVEGVNLTGAVKELTNDATYNVVVVSGESQDPEDGTPKTPPVRGSAEDTNPDSPTWTGGDFGRTVRFFSSPFITTQAQANDVAAAILERSLMLTERVVFDALPNPAAEAYDVVYVKASRARINHRYLLEAFAIPLNVEDTMTGSLVKRRTSG